jgi:hypothetical protein
MEDFVKVLKKVMLSAVVLVMLVSATPAQAGNNNRLFDSGPSGASSGESSRLLDSGHQIAARFFSWLLG